MSWMTGLGEAILGGQNAFRQRTQDVQQAEQAKLQQQAQQQMLLLNQRESARQDAELQDRLAAAPNRRALEAANLGLVQAKVASLPKDQAEDDMQAGLKTFGPIAALSQPSYLDAAQRRGVPIPTKPLPNQLDSRKFGATGPIDDSQEAERQRQGLAPVTGAVYPPEIANTLQKQGEELKARKQLQSGAMGPEYQKAFAYEQAGGKNPPAALLKQEDEWSAPIKNGNALAQVNKRTGEVRHLGKMGGPAGGSAANALTAGQLATDNEIAAAAAKGTTGEALLALMSPLDASRVKGMLAYEGQVPSTRGGPLQRIADLARLVDSTFSLPEYNVRSNLRKDYGPGGKTGNNIKALNTAAPHLDLLAQKLQAMHNSASPAYNAVANAFDSSIIGSGKVKAAHLAARAEASELASVFKQSGATDPEIATFMQLFDDPAMTPATQKAITTTAAQLFRGRRHPIEYDYKRIMKADPPALFTPETESILNKYAGADEATGGVPNVATGPTGKIRVVAPDGSHDFDTQAQADTFKKLAGLK